MIKYVNSAFIIDRLRRDFEFEDKFIVPTDLIEWIGDGLLKLPQDKLMLTKITDCDSNNDACIIIEDYKALLPCDLIELYQVRDAETKVVLNYSTDLYIHHKEPIGSCPVEYTIQDNYIYTNTEEGSLELVYKAMKLDVEFKPMIPDIENVIDYVVKFLATRVSFKLSLRGLFSERNYMRIAGQADVAKLKAMNSLLMPSLEESAGIANEWNRLTRSRFHRNYSYRDLGKYSR